MKNDRAIPEQYDFAAVAGLPVSPPCDLDDLVDDRCGLGLNGLCCTFPLGHLRPEHSWELR